MLNSDQQFGSALLQLLQTSNGDPCVHGSILIVLGGLLKVLLNILCRLAICTSQIAQPLVEESFGLLQRLFLLAVRTPRFSDERGDLGKTVPTEQGLSIRALGVCHDFRVADRQRARGHLVCLTELACGFVRLGFRRELSFGTAG